MPFLSSRIYRSAVESDGPAFTSGAVSQLENAAQNGDDRRDSSWSWDAAEERLSVAYDRGGVGEWAECALRELEAEEEVERRRRGL